VPRGGEDMEAQKHYVSLLHGSEGKFISQMHSESGIRQDTNGQTHSTPSGEPFTSHDRTDKNNAEMTQFACQNCKKPFW
jgi:hypothetical protein